MAATNSITTFLHGALACAVVYACGCAAESSALDASTGDGPARIDGGSSASWTTHAPVPQAVQETAVVELDGIIYVLGGFDANGTTLNRVSAYEVATNTWSSVAPMPLAVHHVNAAVVGGKIYVVGSLVANFGSHGGVWEFDPSQNAWATLSDMPAGTERGSAAVGVIDGTIYLAGGFRSLASVSDVSSYSP